MKRHELFVSDKRKIETSYFASKDKFFSNFSDMKMYVENERAKRNKNTNQFQ